jgi:hypothetical protein
VILSVTGCTCAVSLESRRDHIIIITNKSLEAETKVELSANWTLRHAEQQKEMGNVWYFQSFRYPFSYHLSAKNLRYCYVQNRNVACCGCGTRSVTFKGEC